MSAFFSSSSSIDLIFSISHTYNEQQQLFFLIQAFVIVAAAPERNATTGSIIFKTRKDVLKRKRVTCICKSCPPSRKKCEKCEVLRLFHLAFWGKTPIDFGLALIEAPILGRKLLLT